MIRIILLILFFFHIKSYSLQTIQLGVEDINYYPIYGTFDFEDNQLKDYEGLSADIFRLFNKSQNEYEIIFNPRPVKRLYIEFLLKNSNLDAKFPDNPLWNKEQKVEAQKKIFYSDPILEYTDGAFVLNENKNLNINNLKSIGILAGFSPIGYEEKINSGNIIVEESFNVNSLLEKLLRKRLDAVYLSKFVMICKTQKLKKSNLVLFSNKLPNNSGYYYISTSKYPKFIKLFNEFLKNKKNTINKMQDYYLKFKCN
ncbi:transporter substrate-binding domain-containing protein [Silvanigrella paludirubra]|uniref:Transporter substrate-binding domain-containing protein n=1 Tax=Silvanigrella paludirubra TaxID=2499159 RepID=A0A6N6W0Z5_9BACT|nr:transporter substrate-binding domain-containing protein [Silvanigrella paludirubra]KAB8041108.1 transporter substrate-binding domain-containing protein [Silvanigrella paludirubra]